MIQQAYKYISLNLWPCLTSFQLKITYIWLGTGKEWVATGTGQQYHGLSIWPHQSSHLHILHNFKLNYLQTNAGICKQCFHSFIEFYVIHLKNQEEDFDHGSTLSNTKYIFRHSLHDRQFIFLFELLIIIIIRYMGI